MSTAVSRMNAIAYGNGRFVAVGGGFNTDPAHRIFTSSNSVDWTSHASTENQFYGIAFGGGQFVATTGGRRMLTSPDGETWAAHTNNATNVFVSAITYGNGTFVAVGSQNQSQHTVLYSYDGTNWQSRYFGPVIGNYFLNGVAFGAGTFVAVGMPPSVLQSEDVHRPFLTLSAGDPLQFRLGGKVDEAFRLQSSSNLNTWDDVMTYTNVSPVMSLSIPATNSSSQLFFRSIQD